MQVQVLIVEDHAATAAALVEMLASEGHVAHVVEEGHEALREARSRPPALVILDRRLPDLDGVEVCRRLRSGGLTCPVLMLTGKGSTTELVQGLEAGADDYLVKPVQPDELRARIRVLLRRGGRQPEDGHHLRAGDVELDPAARRAWRAGAELTLTPREFALLHVLVAESGRAVSRAELLRRAWGAEVGGRTPNVVDVYVRYLRRKLMTEGAGDPIASVRGVGYRFDAAILAGPGTPSRNP